VVTFGLCVLPATPSARAADPGSSVDLTAPLMWSLSAVPILAGVVAGAGNTATSARGQRPHPLAVVNGYFFAGANLGLGVAHLAWTRTLDSRGGWPSKTSLAIGIVNLAVGAFDLGVTIWSHSLPREKNRQLSLVPIGGSDAMGRPIAGIGVRLLSL